MNVKRTTHCRNGQVVKQFCQSDLALCYDNNQHCCAGDRYCPGRYTTESERTPGELAISCMLARNACELGDTQACDSAVDICTHFRGLTSKPVLAE